jgi:hypothetical protein
MAGDVHEAMKALGWAVPQDEEEVEQAEQALGRSPVPLPESLRDPEAVFERGGRGEQGRPSALAFPGSADIDATLARAAREAGRLTPEIEQRMRRDREAAEREFSDEEGKKGPEATDCPGS